MSSRVAPTHSLESGRPELAARRAARAVSPDVAIALGVSLVLALALVAFHDGFAELFGVVTDDERSHWETVRDHGPVHSEAVARLAPKRPTKHAKH